LIEIEHITKQFRDVVALDDITVTIPGGRIALLGPNGAGKSTFLKIILGLIPPDSGRGTVLGHDLLEAQLEIRKRIGYMPEHDCLPLDMNAVEFVSIMGRLSGMPKTKAIERAHEVLYYLNMRDERYRNIGTYSGGTRQKVKLAQAIVHDPDIVFMDEPTSGLDPIARNEMLTALNAMSSRGHTNYILSTHLLHDVEHICDRVVMLYQGKVAMQDTLSNLLVTGHTHIAVRTLSEPEDLVRLLSDHEYEAETFGDEVIVTKRSDDDVNSIVGLMAKHRFPLRRIKTRVRELDDVYIELLRQRGGEGPD
jgi:ABC-2 type transport system ATP-binding protein